MKDPWTERWNDRYRAANYAYGEIPNQYLKGQLEKLPVGNILFPAEGEGRNAVFAAKLGWKVSAFDISTEGKKKALALAETNDVTIDYQVGSIETLPYMSAQFDAIALIFAHFPAAIKSACHHALDKLLKPGGIIIFEAFSKKHLDYIAKNESFGGPRDIDQLFSVEELKSDFASYRMVELVETEVELKEGTFHNGLGSVVRMVGVKG